MDGTGFDETMIDRMRGVVDRASVSKAAFAQRVRLTPGQLAEALQGVRPFTSLDLALIAEAGATTVEWLLTGRGPSRPFSPVCTGGEPERDRVSGVGRHCTSACEVLELLGRLPECVLTVETSHLAGVAAASQEHVRVDARQHRAHVTFELLKAYEAGDTTLRPLATLLGVEVDWLHEALDLAESFSR